MGNSPSVPKLRARDPEGVEAGAGGGELLSGCVRLPPPPHPAHPTAAATTSCPAGVVGGQGTPVGVHGPGTRSGTSPSQLQGHLLVSPRLVPGTGGHYCATRALTPADSAIYPSPQLCPEVEYPRPDPCVWLSRLSMQK